MRRTTRPAVRHRRNPHPHRVRASQGRALLLFALFASILSACSSLPPTEVLGAYRLSDDRLVSVRRSVEASLRYRVFDDGESRRLYPVGPFELVSGPGFTDREPVTLRIRFTPGPEGAVTALRWQEAAGPELTGVRIGRDLPVTFESDGTELVGRIDLPTGPGPHPAVVLVHGSGDQPATEYYPNGDFLAANGIATLTFDKRGTGASAGEVTFDFRQLARDVVAAVDHLRSRPEIDGERLGLCGYSQGGWVAPLAASLSDHVAFVVVSYGMIESPADEARLETRIELRKRGLGEDALAEVDRLTAAAVRVVAEDFEEGWDELEALERELADEPWRPQLAGTVVGRLMTYPKWLSRLLGRRLAPPGLDWYHDSTSLLESLSTPMVWLLGDADESAPNAGTIQTLRRLRAEGKPYELVLFPNADHGMLLFDLVDGERRFTGYAPAYFRTEVEAVGRLAGSGTAPTPRN